MTDRKIEIIEMSFEGKRMPKYHEALLLSKQSNLEVTKNERPVWVFRKKISQKLK